MVAKMFWRFFDRSRVELNVQPRRRRVKHFRGDEWSRSSIHSAFCIEERLHGEGKGHFDASVGVGTGHPRHSVNTRMPSFVSCANRRTRVRSSWKP
jgi:hypothetical protein